MTRGKKFWFCGGMSWALLCGVPESAFARLPARSPFHSPQETPAAPAAELPLEYHGYLHTADGFQFWVRDPARRSGAFVKLNVPESELRLVARNFDPEKSTLTVERDGRVFTLPERKAKVRLAGLPASPRPVAPRTGGDMPARVVESVVVNPSPAQEQARLDVIAAEINRRRGLREQAAQGAGPAPRP
jgi:hypothetical protein